MRVAVSGLLLSIMAFGQTPQTPTVGDWTLLTGLQGWTSGMTTVGYGKSVYIDNSTLGRRLHCMWDSVKIPGSYNSEGNNAHICFDYEEKRWVPLAVGQMWNSPQLSGAGHSVGYYTYLANKGRLAYMAADGSGPNVAQKFPKQFWNFDIGGMYGQNREMSPTAWMSGGTTPTGVAIHDVTNDKIVYYPAESTSGVNVTMVYDPNTETVVTYDITASGGVQPPTNFSTGFYNSTNNKIYLYSALNQNVWEWDTPTHTWTLMTNSCTGAACTGSPAAPPSRCYNGFAYTPVDDFALMAGGQNLCSSATSNFTDTWEYRVTGTHTGSWTQRTTATAYQNSTGNTTHDRLTYDVASNAFVMVTPSNSLQVYVYAASTALAAGRTSNTYSATSGSINRVAPSTTTSWSFKPSLAVNGTTIYAGFVESFPNNDTSSCSNGSFHPYVQSTPNSGTWTNLPSGSQATACAAMDSEASGNTVAENVKVAYINGTLWAAWSKWNTTTYPYQGFAKSWNGSAWSGGAIGCFSSGATCVAGKSQHVESLIPVGTTPTVAVIEWDSVTNPPTGRLYVAQNTGSWTRLSAGQVNITTNITRALSASLATNGTVPTVCWSEERIDSSSIQGALLQMPGINCATYNSGTTAFDRFGSSVLNHTASTYAKDPSVAFIGSSYYVAWTERTQTGNSLLWVCQWTGSACTWLGGAAQNINVSTGWATNPRLTTDGTDLFMSWEESTSNGTKNRTYVKKWNVAGASWSSLGGAIAADGTSGSVEGADIAMVSGAPTVIFGEMKYGTWRQIYAKQWSGAAWLDIGSSAVAPTITTTTLPNGTKGTAYSQTLAATGSPVPTWTVTAGALPAGLSLSSGGIISGTPTKVGTASFTVTATNGVAPDDTQALTILIQSSFSVTLDAREALYSGGTTGKARTNETTCGGVPIPDPEAILDTTALALSGATAGQFRILGTWPSGNAKWIHVCGVLASLTAGATASLTLTANGTGNFGGSSMATDNGTTITVATGTATFTVKKANFNGLDVVDVGATHVVLTGQSQGVVLVGPDPTAAYPGNVTCSPTAGGSACATVYTSANDASSTCSIEENGPVRAVLKCSGSLIDGAAHTYMKHTTRLFFNASKNTVRTQVVLRNADYGTSSTFASATKAYQSLELRVKANITGTLSYAIANHTATPTSGTLNASGGTDYAYLYQAESSQMKPSNWCACTPGSGCTSISCVIPSPLTGYAIVANGSASATGTNSQYPVGWANVEDASGIGVEIGQYQLAAYGNKSLEFQAGGNDIRVGLWAGQNNTTSTSTLTPNKPYYQLWPQWNVQEGILDFHATTRGSTAAEDAFLSYQHPVITKAQYTDYNAASVFPFPLLDPAAETAYYTNLNTSTPPSTTKPPLEDMGLTRTTPTQYWINVYKAFAWEAGGGGNQMGFRRARDYNFIRRGWTGGFIEASHFYNLYINNAYPMSDGFSWRTHTGEVDSSGNPTITSTNGGPSTSTNLATINRQEKFEHDHGYGAVQHYWLTGDETLHDWLSNGPKNHFLSTATVVDTGRLWNARAMGTTLMWQAALYDLFSSTGDSDASATLTQGEKVYTKQIRPDLCVATPGGNYPTGCNLGAPNATNGTGANAYKQGTSSLQGVNYAYGDAIVQSTACATNPTAVRGAAHYQNGVLLNGIHEFRKAYGSGWQYYTESLDTAYGISQWSQNTMFFSGANWNSSGPRYYQAVDYVNQCDLSGTGTHYYGIQNLNSAWMPYKIYGEYGIPPSSGWQEKLNRTIQKYINDGAVEETYLYTIQDAIYSALHPPAATLQTVAISGFVDNGAGSYTLTWTPIAGTVSHRVKWGTRQILDWIGFDAGTLTYSNDPAVYQNWFASTEASGTPTCTATCSLTVATGQTGLTSANFMVKEFATGSVSAGAGPTIGAGKIFKGGR